MTGTRVELGVAKQAAATHQCNTATADVAPNSYPFAVGVWRSVIPLGPCCGVDGGAHPAEPRVRPLVL